MRVVVALEEAAIVLTVVVWHWGWQIDAGILVARTCDQRNGNISGVPDIAKRLSRPSTGPDAISVNPFTVPRSSSFSSGFLRRCITMHKT